MAFADHFDGYLLLHSPRLAPERLPLARQALAGIGLSEVECVAPVEVSAAQLAESAYQRVAVLSVLRSLKACIELAEQRGWQHFVFLEDDVCFHPAFARHWQALESGLQGLDWGLLTLHRWPVRTREVVVRGSLLGRAHWMQVEHNSGGQVMIFRRDFYRPMLETLSACERLGWPADFCYGMLSQSHPGRVFCSSLNLSGQRGGLLSSVQQGLRRGGSHYARFRSSHCWVDYVLVNLAAWLRDRLS